MWSRHDGAANRSEILALLLDDRGRARGEPRLVRRTSGDVVDLDVHRRGGAAWIAWAAHLSPDSDPPRALIAAVHIEPDLSAMHPPISLHQFASQDLGAWPERDHVRVLALADGGAAIATVSSSAECTDIVTDRRGKCPGYEVRWARPDGTSSLAGKFGADGGDPDMLDLVDIGTGVVSTIYAWHGGATYGHLYAPYHAAAAASPVPLHDCRPPFTRAWTGDELVTICPDDYADEKEACKLNGVSAESGACTRVHTAVKSDRAVALVSEKRRCEDGHPVIDLAWKGGKIRLDPSAPGASMAPVLGVWTGTNAVKLTADGARELWTCNKSGELVAGEPIDDTLALDPDPTPLKSIPAHRP